MKKGFILLLVTLVAVLGFSFNFGGGGTYIGYIPGTEIKSPLGDSFSFENGLIYYGGHGEGRISDWMMIGGDGFSGSLKSGNYSHNFEYGALTITNTFDFLRFINFSIGSGLGSLKYSITKKVENSNQNIGFNTFKDNTCDYISLISNDYLVAAPFITISLKPAPFFQIDVSARYMVGYSLDGWKFETGKVVDGGKTSTLLQSYNFYAGLSWGF